ncbi:hypothetical protein FUA26_01130 [Seonamhaeicola algicola]|uniref:Nicotinate-nucleotide adenylyltransferase n=1 Tax=Seonamhaeicola algicola TaxID=1719036 RepID=A0A5C7B332_9FLAO|nr:hypothetical protein [Seonamhaeicola algicola]TXE15141.1 hypothetical protein FUA26_01130 [Seonamhaeicola algicola]
MKLLVTNLLTLFALFIVNAQTITLPNTVITVNSDYASTFEDLNALCIKKLQTIVTDFNCETIAELYDKKDDVYSVNFTTNNGEIVAYYTKDGNIVRAYETFNNVRLPLEVSQAVCKKYPNCCIVEDVYVLKYNAKKGIAKKEYKITLKLNNEIIKIKTNERGEFI